MLPFDFQREGIALRAFDPADVPALWSYLNDPALEGCRHLPHGFPDLAPLSSRRVEAVIELWQKEEKGWTLAVTDAATAELLGHVHAGWEWDPHCPSASVVIAPAKQRRGVGSAALEIAVDYLFLETPAHVVSGWTASWNDAALAFAVRNRFHEAGRRPRAGVRGGAFTSDVAFDLLRSEWEAAGRRLHGT
jgi:RimJ/RimL family protein N-acetyltransferase